MIPKIIHYCWFGRNPLPKSAQKCIASWKKFFPDYEIKEWNEDNFDVRMMPYTADAYGAKKYAYVSDVARFWVLYHEGGLYFDTDVEVIRPMDDIIAKGPFMGVEIPVWLDGFPGVNPGLGLAAIHQMDFYRQMLDCYKNMKFPSVGTVVMQTTEMLKRNGLTKNCDFQQVADINIYPKDYFCPFDDISGKLNKTSNTRTIHWYSKSWQDKPMWYFKVTRILHRIFGTRLLAKLK